MEWSPRLATRDDHDALVGLLRDVTMEGAVSLAQDRAPDFFAMGALHDAAFDPWVAETAGGDIVGCGTLVTRPGWFPDGALRPVSYICDLRVLPAWRGAKVLPRLGRAALEHGREGHGSEVAYMAAVDDNRRLVRAVTERHGRRADQPVSRPMTRYEMVNVLAMPRSTRTRAERCDDLEEIASFLDRHARGRLFGRPIEAKRLERIGLPFLVVRRRGRIAAAAACWDVHTAKRMRVVGYSRGMRAFRSAHAPLARLLGRPALPAEGEDLRYATLAFLEVDDDDPRMLRELLHAAWRDVRDRHFLSVMVPRGSALRRAFRGAWVSATPMTLYTTLLPDSPWAARELTSSRPGFEMALA